VTSPRLLKWEELTQAAFDQLDRPECVVFVTCSPLEVHGPHLPLGADVFEGEALAERVLGFLPERHRRRTFLKVPSLFIGSDSTPHPGSIRHRPSTIIAAIEDLGDSLATQGFRRVLVSNFHGSPRHFLAIEEACERVSRRHAVTMASAFSLLLRALTKNGGRIMETLAAVQGAARKDLEGDTHAGLVETSQLLALKPDLVDPMYRSLDRQTTNTWLESRGERPTPVGLGQPAPPLELARGYLALARYFKEETYAGAPASASAQLGEGFLDTLAGRAAAVVSDLLDGKLDPDDCHSPLWAYRFFFLNPLIVRLSDSLLGV
jgi:creatinine amidohydrolase